MSYPPAHHLLRDLAFTGEHAEGRTRNRIEVTPGLLDDVGVRLGVVATLVDVGGAGVALASVSPDWIATADLAVHLLHPITAGVVDVVCEPLRVGSRSIVVGARIVDANGRSCGTGRMAFARIPGTATKASIERSPAATPARTGLDGGSPIVEPVADRCGFVPVGPGQIRFDKTPYVENSFGTINGGVMALAAEVAAVSACGGGHAVDLQIHYLEQVGDGPVAVTGEVVRPGAVALVQVRAEDRATGRLVAVSDVTVDPG